MQPTSTAVSHHDDDTWSGDDQVESNRLPCLAKRVVESCKNIHVIVLVSFTFCPGLARGYSAGAQTYWARSKVSNPGVSTGARQHMQDALTSIGQALPPAADAPAKFHGAGTASFFSIPGIRIAYASSPGTMRSCRRIGTARRRETGRSCRTRARVNFHHYARHTHETWPAHETVAAVSADDNTGFALSVPLARAGSRRAELRMNVNSDAT
jgi:hypothetical protein